MEDFHNYQDQVVVTFHDEIGDYLDTNYSDIVSEAATMMWQRLFLNSMLL